MAARQRRILVVAGLVLATVASVAALWPSADERHTLFVDFTDAGQVVEGGRVTIATRRIGRVAGMRLSPNGLARLELVIDDDAWPLRDGTTMTIRLTSGVGIANRYVAVTPGGVHGRPLRDGEVIDRLNTNSVVDLDQTLNDFTPKVRRDLRAVVQRSERSLHGVADDANRGLAFGFPAIDQTGQLLAQLTEDPTAIRRLASAGGRVAAAFARNANALSDSIDQSAIALRAVAAERGTLAALLTRAPRVLRGSTATLRRTRISLDRSVRPLLRRFAPAARPLAQVLTLLPPVARDAVPLLQQTRALFPPTAEGLRLAPGLARRFVPSLATQAKALEDGVPYLSAMRQYGPEVAMNAGPVYGAVTGYYDANGHYARINYLVGEDGSIGSLEAFLDTPTREGFSSGHLSPCPGGSTDPAADGSNPRIEDASICDPKDNFK